ncbi:15443_t:CDS:2 [Funneliformis caledonium]|uniref:15443_t:CDS:1 n=1 Tax=Funneliformis caledonium TaxID=1117310 RepID=A0A9N9FJL0_9GLOM|nr:15443_t:CDS:2 [Funneliformis caledonium]
MSKNGSFSSVNETVGVDESENIAMETDFDLDRLDLNRSYTLKEFEMINEQLKYRTLEINGIFTNLFELDKFGKLVPIPLTPFRYNVIVTEVTSQLANWNVWTRQKGAVTVAFTPDFIRRNLTYEQLNTFHGKPFNPTFVVEVDNVENIDSEKFKQLDVKFKESYFDPLTSIQLGGNVFRRYCNWSNLDGDDTLPGFTLEVSRIEELVPR